MTNDLIIISSDAERTLTQNNHNGCYIIKDNNGFKLVGDWSFDVAMEILEDADEFECQAGLQ